MADPGPGFTIEEFRAGDGYRWHYRRYVPPSLPRAHVVCIHGIQSHGGWYEHSCDRLRQAGFLVYFLDRRGSGLNERDRGDAPNFSRLIDDVAEFLQTLHPPPSTLHPPPSTLHPPPSTLHPPPSSLPVFLVAISWGAKVGAALQRRHPGLIEGLALLCPGFFPHVRPPLRQRAAILASRLMDPRKLFPIPLNDPQLFTATPRWQNFIRDDPLSLRQATARLLLESVRLDFYRRLVPPHIRVPVLLVLAGNDRIIDNGRTRRFVKRFASADSEVIEYPDAHHTLEFEPDPEPFIHDLGRWLERQTDERSKGP